MLITTKNLIKNAGRSAVNWYLNLSTTDVSEILISLSYRQHLSEDNNQADTCVLSFHINEIIEAKKFHSLKVQFKDRALEFLSDESKSTYDLVKDILEIKFVGYFEKTSV